ncbi:hypothetical protein BJ546DRAFT_489532 [Cryomyces antarcticus]
MSVFRSNTDGPSPPKRQMTKSPFQSSTATMTSGTTADASSMSTVSNFFGLPRQIRDRIYSCFIQPSFTGRRIWHSHSNRVYVGTGCSISHSYPIALTLVSRCMTEEFLEIVCKEASFHAYIRGGFDPHPKESRLFQQLTSTVLQHMRHVSIKVVWNDHTPQSSLFDLRPFGRFSTMDDHITPVLRAMTAVRDLAIDLKLLCLAGDSHRVECADIDQAFEASKGLRNVGGVTYIAYHTVNSVGSQETFAWTRDFGCPRHLADNGGSAY